MPRVAHSTKGNHGKNLLLKAHVIEQRAMLRLSLQNGIAKDDQQRKVAIGPNVTRD